MATRKQIYNYMIGVMSEYTDYQTDEINTTFMAEDACDHFKAYLNDTEYDIPNEYYDIAFDVATNNGLNTY